MKTLKKKIEEKGLKIKWIAEKVGVSPTLLSMYLSEVRNIPGNIKEKIEELLKK